MPLLLLELASATLMLPLQLPIVVASLPPSSCVELLQLSLLRRCATAVFFLSYAPLLLPWPAAHAFASASSSASCFCFCCCFIFFESSKVRRFFFIESRLGRICLQSSLSLIHLRLVVFEFYFCPYFVFIFLEVKIVKYLILVLFVVHR